MEESTQFRFFRRNVSLLQQVLLFLAVRFAASAVHLSSLQCPGCVEVDRAAAFAVDNLKTPTELFIRMSHDLEEHECKCPSNAVEDSEFVTNYPFMTRFNVTFKRSGRWFIDVMDSDRNSLDSTTINVYEQDESFHCNGTKIVVQFGTTDQTSAEELSSSIPKTSTGDYKIFKAYPNDEEACQDANYTWQVERFAVDYDGGYCILPNRVKKVDLTAFNSEKSYIPADVTDTGKAFRLAPFMIPTGFLRVRLFIDYPELNEHYELFSYFKVEQELDEFSGHIRSVPEADQICAPTLPIFTLDASRTYSSYLTPGSSFTGTPYKHEAFRWVCRGSTYVCKRMRVKRGKHDYGGCVLI